MADKKLAVSRLKINCCAKLCYREFTVTELSHNSNFDVALVVSDYGVAAQLAASHKSDEQSLVYERTGAWAPCNLSSILNSNSKKEFQIPIRDNGSFRVPFRAHSQFPLLLPPIALSCATTT